MSADIYTASFPQRLPLHYKAHLFMTNLRKVLIPVEKGCADSYNPHVFDNDMHPLYPRTTKRECICVN